MADELEVDLTAAAADGVDASTYVGGDPRRFAEDWAVARGVVRARPRLIATAIVALVGAMPGAAFALFAAYGLSSPAVAELLGAQLPSPPAWCLERPDCTFTAVAGISAPAWALVLLYLLGGAFAYAGAVAAVSALLHWRLDPAARATTRLLMWGLPAATVAAVFGAVLFAWTQDFSTATRIALADVVVSAVFAAAVVVIRLRAIREVNRTPIGPSETPALVG